MCRKQAVRRACEQRCGNNGTGAVVKWSMLVDFSVGFHLGESTSSLRRTFSHTRHLSQAEIFSSLMLPRYMPHSTLLSSDTEREGHAFSISSRVTLVQQQYHRSAERAG